MAYVLGLESCWIYISYCHVPAAALFKGLILHRVLMVNYLRVLGSSGVFMLVYVVLRSSQNRQRARKVWQQICVGVKMSLANLMASLIMSSIDSITGKDGNDSWVSIFKQHSNSAILCWSQLSQVSWCITETRVEEEVQMLGFANFYFYIDENKLV